MKHILIIASALFALTIASFADDADVAAKLESVSVTIHAEGGQGSGTIVTRDGQNFVLTAAHVCEDNRKVQEVIENGQKRTEVSFEPVTIVREVYVDGESVGTTEMKGDIIAFSSPDYGQDLALIHLRGAITQESIEFNDARITPVGTELAHLGSLHGQNGSNSFTVGNCSQIGRVYREKLFDQSSCPSFPGSSGGSISLRKDGRYVGMLVRGSGETFNLFIPLRRMRQWATEHHVDFIFDPKSKPDLTKVKLETREPTKAASVVIETP